MVTIVRNSKFYGLQLTDDFLLAYKKHLKVLNRISKHIRKMLVNKEIVNIQKFSIVLSDGTTITAAQLKDRLDFLFPEIEKKESLKRSCLMYILERYSGYESRNQDGKIPTITIKDKGLYYKDNFVKINRDAKTLTFQTLFGDFAIKYSFSLKDNFITKDSTGGNFNLKQKCFIVAVNIPFDQRYGEPEMFLGFDLNKTAADWVVLNNGAKIQCAEEVVNKCNEIREVNKLLGQKDLPIVEREHRSQHRRTLRIQWKKLHKELKKMIRPVAKHIVKEAIKAKAVLAIDSVKTGQRLGTFGQDYLIPACQEICEDKGVPFYVVPCANTSRRCSECGFTHKDNRIDTDTFRCKKCGYEPNAQENAAHNVAYVAERLYKAGVPYGNYSRRNADNLIKKFSAEQK